MITTIKTEIKNNNRNQRFGRALTPQEKPDYIQTANQAKELLGANGKTILIVPEACLPQGQKNNTGMGNLSSKESVDFFDLMKTYVGVNHVQTLPMGNIEPSVTSIEAEEAKKENRNIKQFYCNYSSSAMSLGTDHANLELMTTPEWGSLLTEKDLQQVVKANTAPVDSVNYENVVGKDIDKNGKRIVEESPHNKALRKAFVNLKKSDTPSATKLKAKFEKYKKTEAERLQPKALFSVLEKEHGTSSWEDWNELDKNLLLPETDKNKALERINQLNKNHSEDIEFYKFQQFIADEHLSHGKKLLNDKDQKLILDCPIGFSKDEVWSHRGAFKKDVYIGNPNWKLPALDYDKIRNSDGSLGEAGKLLEKKFEFNYKRADGVRFDVGWAYVKPIVLHPMSPEESNRVKSQITFKDESIESLHGTEYFHDPDSPTLFKVQRYDMQDQIIKLAEDTAKKTKGNDFNLNNLSYEAVAGPREFTAFNWFDNSMPKAEVISPLKGRNLIFSTEHMSEGWGSVDFFTRQAGMSAENLIIGVGNHDPLSLRQLAEGICEEGQKENQLEPLSNALKVSKESIQSPKEFAKAKFAELFTGGKNHMFFYMDVFGRKERFDEQDKNSSKNYRYKITDNFEANYHKSLQEGHGFNLMDALDKAFKARQLDKNHPELYQKIIKFSNILKEVEPQKTEAKHCLPKSENAGEPSAVKSNKKWYAIAAGSMAAIGLLYYLFKNKNESSKS